jgi:hypothetical protein
MSRIRIFGLLAIGLCSAALWGQDSNGSLRGIVQNSTRTRIHGTPPSTGLSTHNNYLNLVIGHPYAFTPTVVGNLTLSGGGLHLAQTRNSNLGFALAFPFSSTALPVSGFETCDDNQFAIPITPFPSQRDQHKYQVRYDF